MNIVEILLVLVGIPLAVIAVLALLISSPAGASAPATSPASRGSTRRSGTSRTPSTARPAGHPAAACPGLDGGPRLVDVPEQPGERNTDAQGGAGPRRRVGRGASAAPRRVDAGPLGGARGTW